LANYFGWSDYFWADNVPLAKLVRPDVLKEKPFLEDPTMARAYKEYLARGDAIRSTQDAYFALPQGSQARKAYLQQHPELSQYWDWKSNFEKQYPKIAATLSPQSLVNRANAPRYPTTTRAASANQISYLQSLGYRGNTNLSGDLASQLIEQYRARQTSYAPRQTTPSYAPSYAPRATSTPVYYAPRSTYTPAPKKANTYGELAKTVTDKELLAQLQEYLYQSKAGRGSVLKKYPKLAALLAGKSEAEIDALTADYLLARRVGKVARYYSGATQ